VALTAFRKHMMRKTKRQHKSKLFVQYLTNSLHKRHAFHRLLLSLVYSPLFVYIYKVQWRHWTAASEMTYIVSSGALNSTHSRRHWTEQNHAAML